MPTLHTEASFRHLSALDPTPREFIFLATDDTGQNRPAITMWDTFANLRSRIAHLQRQGYGIHVTVNAMRGRLRRTGELVRVRAIWRERDRADVPALPLEPSFITTTSPGKGHDWIFVDGLSPEEAEALNRVLVTQYGGDPHARDLYRVLRLAGTYNLKYGSPYLVRHVGGTGQIYSRAEILAAISLPPPPPPPEVSPPVARGDRWLDAAVRGVCSDLAGARQGARNATLNATSYRLGRLGLTLGDATATLAPIAIGIGLGRTEVLRTIRSGWSAGAAAPLAERAA